MVKHFGAVLMVMLVSLFVMNSGLVLAAEAEQEKQVSTEVSETQAPKIDVNSATVEELESLPGIGPKLAQAIIAARPFASVDDLLRVKGIGEKKLAKFKDLVVAMIPEGAEAKEAAKTTELKQLDLNSATLEELVTLPGIGKKTAEAIIAARPFEKIEDLLNLKGLTAKNLERIKDLVEVNPVKPAEEAKQPEKTE